VELIYLLRQPLKSCLGLTNFVNFGIFYNFSDKNVGFV